MENIPQPPVYTPYTPTYTPYYPTKKPPFALGKRWQPFLRLMRDVEAENERFSFCLDPFANQ